MKLLEGFFCLVGAGGLLGAAIPTDSECSESTSVHKSTLEVVCDTTETCNDAGAECKKRYYAVYDPIWGYTDEVEYCRCSEITQLPGGASVCHAYYYAQYDYDGWLVEEGIACTSGECGDACEPTGPVYRNCVCP